MDTELANDRTFLAWLRTGIALFGLGFVVAKVAFIVQPDSTGIRSQELYSAVGVLIVLSGAVLVLVGYLQHARVSTALRCPEEAPMPRWPFAITAVAAVGALVLSAPIAASS